MQSGVFSVSTESRQKRDGSSPKKQQIKVQKANNLKIRLKGSNSYKSSVNFSQSRGGKRTNLVASSCGASSVKSGASGKKVYKPDDLIIIPQNFDFKILNGNENLDSESDGKQK